MDHYHRALDIANALAKITYEINGVTYTREYLASAPDQLIALHFTAGKPGMLDFSIVVRSPPTRKHIAIEDGTLVLSGLGETVENKAGKIEFNTRITPVLKGEVFPLPIPRCTLAGAMR